MRGRFKQVMNATPRWATQLNVGNVLLFCPLIGLTWAVPLLQGENTTAAATRNFQRLGIAEIVVCAAVLIAWTAHDIQRYRQARELLRRPEQFLTAMAEHFAAGGHSSRYRRFLIAHGGSMPPANQDCYKQLSYTERIDLALMFLRYLASNDRRWWKPVNLRRSAIRGLTCVPLIVHLILAALMPLKLYQLVQNLRSRKRG